MKPASDNDPSRAGRQPPSGGCVLKLRSLHLPPHVAAPAAFGRLCVETPAAACCSGRPIQPPSGGCVLKHEKVSIHICQSAQPPSGGCVLKQQVGAVWVVALSQPPSGGCVLKQAKTMPKMYRTAQPPSGGCVLKPNIYLSEAHYADASRLRAAVC